jgi:hypothetical protein
MHLLPRSSFLRAGEERLGARPEEETVLAALERIERARRGNAG